LPNELSQIVQAEIDRGLPEYDSRDPQHDREVRRIAEMLLDADAGSESVCALEEQLIQRSDGAPLAAHPAVKLARSRRVSR
jgi:hypothetical protein